MQTARRTTPFIPALLSARDSAAGAFRLLLCWQERIAQRRQLGRLDDRALQDIGLSRADIARESMKPFWRE